MNGEWTRSERPSAGRTRASQRCLATAGDGASAEVSGEAAPSGGMAIVEAHQLAAEFALEQLRHQQDRRRRPTLAHAAEGRQAADQLEHLSAVHDRIGDRQHRQHAQGRIEDERRGLKAGGLVRLRLVAHAVAGGHLEAEIPQQPEAGNPFLDALLPVVAGIGADAEKRRMVIVEATGLTQRGQHLRDGGIAGRAVEA